MLSGSGQRSQNYTHKHSPYNYSIKWHLDKGLILLLQFTGDMLRSATWREPKLD